MALGVSARSRRKRQRSTSIGEYWRQDSIGEIRSASADRVRDRCELGAHRCAESGNDANEGGTDQGDHQGVFDDGRAFFTGEKLLEHRMSLPKDVECLEDVYISGLLQG